MLSKKTFEVVATHIGDLKGVWTTITLEDGDASTANAKEGTERVKGIRPAMQGVGCLDTRSHGREPKRAEASDIPRSR
jgi:hypothetical protein